MSPPEKPAEVEVKPTPSDEQRLAMTEPPLDVLLEQAGKLTATCRSIWVTNILGCLYVWLAIASLKDIQLFIPEEGLVLPILQTEISPAGFFVFAPLLLLANYLHLHIMLGRLWTLWGRLRAKGERIDGLPLGERTTPWLLAALLPGEAGDGWLARRVAGFFAYWFGPLTILAAGWRYLRAHELDMQVYHAALVALAVTAMIEFWKATGRAPAARRSRWRHIFDGVAVTGAAAGLFALLVAGAQHLTTNPWTVGWTAGLDSQLLGSVQRALSPHAQLFRAELTRKPEGWSESAYQAALEERARLRNCREEATEGCPEAEALDAKLA